MEEVGLQADLLQDNYLEVWNKIDLIKEADKAQFEERLEQAQSESRKVVLMSCASGYNKQLFLDEIASMTAELKGKKKYSLRYEAWEHAQRLQWIMENAQLTSPPEQMEVSADGQTFEIEVQMDDVVY